jgi:hypothetical protein
MNPGKTRLLAGGTGPRFDHRNAGQNVATLGGATSHIAVADPYAGHVGDSVERAGLQMAEVNVQVTGTWFHWFSHLQMRG